jgi:hypothetical protein
MYLVSSLTARLLRATLARTAGTTLAGAVVLLERFCRFTFRVVVAKALRLPI